MRREPFEEIVTMHGPAVLRMCRAAANKIGITQATISRLEQPHDLLLSTFNAYLEAVGGHASIIVRFADGHEAELDLSQLTPA